jgi:hypothetical protein
MLEFPSAIRIHMLDSALFLESICYNSSCSWNPHFRIFPCSWDPHVRGPKLSQLPTSNFSKVKATTVVVAVRDHEEEEVGTNPYEEGAS